MRKCCMSSRTSGTRRSSRGNDAAALDAKMNMTRGRYLGGAGAPGAGQQVIIILLPV